MESVIAFAGDGGPVLGICNGFQVLCEAGLLPGRAAPQHGPALRLPPGRPRGRGRRHAFTRAAAARERLSIPVKHTTGRYYAPPEELDELEAVGQVVLRYAPGQNPNGSRRDIAGWQRGGNVFGLMPHPEHAVDPLTGSTDGLAIFESMAAVLA